MALKGLALIRRLGYKEGLLSRRRCWLVIVVIVGCMWLEDWFVWFVGVLLVIGFYGGCGAFRVLGGGFCAADFSSVPSTAIHNTLSLGVQLHLSLSSSYSSFSPMSNAPGGMSGLGFGDRG